MFSKLTASAIMDTTTPQTEKDLALYVKSAVHTEDSVCVCVCVRVCHCKPGLAPVDPG